MLDPGRYPTVYPNMFEQRLLANMRITHVKSRYADPSLRCSMRLLPALELRFGSLPHNLTVRIAQPD